MADFCKQCSIENTSEADWSLNLAAVVICEGCGYTQVDPDGNCIGGCDG